MDIPSPLLRLFFKGRECRLTYRLLSKCQEPTFSEPRSNRRSRPIAAFRACTGSGISRILRPRIELYRRHFRESADAVLVAVNKAAVAEMGTD